MNKQTSTGLKDKNGNEVNVGDLLFYSELPFSNYADSIIEIVVHNGEFAAKALVYHNYDNYMQDDCCEPVALKWHTVRDGMLVDSTKMNLSKSDDLLAYMEENHPVTPQTGS